ncbi:hypothetical protein ACIBG6_37985 [Streptomyces sp. NPDC050842]|uniref:hypothetical protein n=1 Tax=Streptomyces sp. NPDC050842 TaxID=3365636 RepID=UPI0037AE521A
MSLPTDYKQIADTYGPGAFCSFVHLYQPHATTPCTSITGSMPSTIRTQLQHNRDGGRRATRQDIALSLPGQDCAAAERAFAALRR